MITPMQELIEWIYTIISVLPDGSGAKNQMIIAKEKAESMLEKEKEVMCAFAKLYDDDLSQGKIRSRENLFNETFNTKEK